MKRWTMLLALVGLLVSAIGQSNRAVEAAPRGAAPTTQQTMHTPASDCQTMLANDFIWANKPDITTSPGTYYQLFLTMTIHTPKTIPTQTGGLANSDLVWYVWGELQPVGTGDQQVLKGTFEAKSSPGFTYSNMDFEVSISKTGTVTVQQKVDGTNFLGRGPEVYQATCNGGLMTFVANQTQGLRSHVLSFTQVQSY